MCAANVRRASACRIDPHTHSTVILEPQGIAPVEHDKLKLIGHWRRIFAGYAANLEIDAVPNYNAKVFRFAFHFEQ
jgi:hypothetical protein